MNLRLDLLLPELLEHLPPTLELLAGSLAIALTVGVASSFAASRTRGRVASGLSRALAIALSSIPFFCLAFSLALWAELGWGKSIFGWASSDRFSARDHLAHLIVPACVLALAELPVVLKALEDLRCEGDFTSGLKTRASLSLRAVAWRFPEIMGACLLTEMAFAWSGEGSLFLKALIRQQAPPAIGVVFLIAIVAFLVRSIVELAVRADLKRTGIRSG